MSYQIEYAKQDRTLFEQIARLWNANATGRHAFYPWTAQRLALLLTDGRGEPVGHCIVAREKGGEVVGFVHFDRMNEDGYPHASAIEAIMVDSKWRGRGIGGALLTAAVTRLAAMQPAPVLVDALGAWPFGYGFNTLADGSERSGVFIKEPALYRLFRRVGFEPVRKSLVMRSELALVEEKPAPAGCGFMIDKRVERTWLDRVFRGRLLWDHELVRSDGRILSRAIFGLMEGESKQEESIIFSLFGVSTPADMQQKGYAGINLSNLMTYVRGLGGDFMEIHVYADNVPALALYRSLGFKELAETVMMHKHL